MMLHIKRKTWIRLLTFFLLLANLFSVSIPGSVSGAKAKKYYKTFNVTLETQSDIFRKEPSLYPCLSYAVYSLPKKELPKNDRLNRVEDRDSDWSEGSDKLRYVHYMIEKSYSKARNKKLYEISIHQQKITTRAATELIIKTAKKHKKLRFIIKLDHYNENGDIVRSDGVVDKKINPNYDTGQDDTVRIPDESLDDDTVPPEDNKIKLSAGQQRVKNEAEEYGASLDASRLSEYDIYGWDYAKPENAAEQKAFDEIIKEIRELCKDPDDTLQNLKWVNPRNAGIPTRCGQLYDDEMRTAYGMYTPSFMSEQRKREIICQLYFLERTAYTPDFNVSQKYEDEDGVYQRILNSTYNGVCGRGACRALRILYCANLGFVPHFIVDFSANHGWLVIESLDRDGTKFNRGFYVTANTFDMKYDIPLEKDEGWYSSYDTRVNQPSIIQSEYYYLRKDVVMAFEDKGVSWRNLVAQYEITRFYYNWACLLDIMVYNDMIKVN